ncbi:MAG TPA: DNA-processing protein DprA [Acidimicrobiia bacterium]
MRLVHPQHPEYPVGLHDLEDPPAIWVAGTLRESPGVSVVGTRRCTRYGVGLSEAFGAAIAAAGWTVVSGLARGIDAAAHRGCLDAHGHAVAVLGSGVDVCYPAENRPLFDRILSTDGAIVSEYPPGTPPDRWRFPARNRIIAAMSAAVVVVEANETGGALITARIGAEIGRPVFVVPGDVDRPASAGCNRLIKDGAHPVLGSTDLIAELELVLGPAPARPVQSFAAVPDGGVDIEDLAELWGVSIAEALGRVGRMELAGEVRRRGTWIHPASRGEPGDPGT